MYAHTLRLSLGNPRALPGYIAASTADYALLPRYHIWPVYVNYDTKAIYSNS